MRPPVYLDYNATTPVAPEVVQAILPFLQQSFGNASSLHAYGRAAHTALETARGQVAGLIGARTAEIVLTGGATEANNRATGMNAQRAMGAVRCSVGAHTTTQEIERAVAALAQAWRCLAQPSWQPRHIDLAHATYLHSRTEETMTSRWTRRPEGSNWGDFGPDDQRGRMNLLTPEKVKQGIAEVKEGKTFCLSLPLDLPGGNVLNPRRHPPRRFATMRSGRANFNCALSHENPDHTDVVSDDVVLLTLQYSTQWDSLAHVGSQFDADGDGSTEIVYYNGWRAGEDIVNRENVDAHEPWARYEGVEAKRLGIENMATACVQGRAVMVDLHAHFGREKKYVGYDDLMRVMQQDKVVVEKGDMVCFHTNFAQAIVEMRGKPDKQVLENSCAGLDGRDGKLLNWITDSGLAALIADNYAVEAYPPRPGSGKHAHLPLHEHCLFKLGIHLGEIWYLTELADWLRANGRNRFLLTAPPLRLPGAVGSPATPVATV